MANDNRPVIASSDRYADILPYCTHLCNEAPKRWHGTMPWEFPQNAPQDVEENFLREQFPAVEIQVQGFRFLKQVWYCIAMNNSEKRIPHVKRAWFEQKGPDYLNDLAIAKHLLSTKANAQTFFEASEIDLYGTEFLNWVVKAIQLEILQQKQLKVQSDSSVALGDKAEGDLTVNKTSQPIVETAPQAPHVTLSDALSQSRSPKDITPMSTMPTTILKPTAPSFSSNNTPVQSMAEPNFQPRTFSGEGPSVPLRVPQTRARGPGGKRNSVHDRTSFQPAQGFYDSRTPSNQTPQQSRQPIRGPPITTMPQFATRGPSSFAIPFASGQPPPPPPSAYHNTQAPPGFQSHSPHISMNDPYAFAPTRAPYTYGPQQLTERPFNNGDARNFANQPGHGNFGPEHSQNKRRESNASYGGKGTTFPGRGRGRGGRGRNSIGRANVGEENFFGSRHPSGAPNEHSGYGNQFDDRQFGATGGHNAEMYGSSRLAKRNENTAPYSRFSEQFPHGPTQILHDPRRASHSQAAPGNIQRTPAGPSFAPAGQYPAPLDVTGDNTKLVSGNGGLPLAEYGCSKKAIGPKCTYAKKLVVFGIPESTSEAEICDFFKKFGAVSQLNGPLVTQHPNGSGSYSRTYITFCDVDGARKCIEQPPMVFHEQHIGVEVAQELWDPEHAKFVRRSDIGISPNDMRKNAPPSMHYVQTSAINVLPFAQPPTATRHGYTLSRSTETFSKDVVSSNTTPTVSGPGTPKAKKKSNKNKTKKSKNVAPYDDSLDRAFVENAQKTRPALSPIPDDSSSFAETVVTGDTTPGKRNDSLRPESSASLQPETCVTPSKLTDIVVQATAADVGVSTSTGSENVVKPVATSSAELTTEPADAHGKSEDEPIDDSFHTASATPGEEVPESSGAEIVPAADSKVEVETSLHTDSESMANIASAEATAASAEIDAQAEVVIKSSQKDVVKANIPALPKSKVSIALPPLDTSKSSSDTITNTEHDVAAALTAVHQRTISGSSDRPSASFVTAPNTPSSPLLGPTSLGEVKSRKEAKTKDKPKPKGPAQVESFSIYGKPKKAKRVNTVTGIGKTGARVVTGPGVQLPQPDFPPVRKVTIKSKPAVITEQPKATAGSSAEIEALQPDENVANADISSVTDVISDILETPTTATVAPPPVPSILRRITDMFSESKPADEVNSMHKSAKDL